MTISCTAAITKRWANKARLDSPYQPAVSSSIYRNSNPNHRFNARPRR